MALTLSSSEKVVRSLLASAGIEVDGKNPWDIQINDPRAYDRILGQGSLGFGESYMDGWWDCDALDQLICRIHEADLREKAKRDMETIALAVRSRLVNLQARRRSYEVAERHYDLGNDLYEPMLGETMALAPARSILFVDVSCRHRETMRSLGLSDRAVMVTKRLSLSLERQVTMPAARSMPASSRMSSSVASPMMWRKFLHM